MSRTALPVLPIERDPPELADFDPGLKAAARALRRPQGHVLFRTGERPRWLFYVLRGEALLQRVTSHGTPVILQRASRGFLAEASLTSSAYHCEAVCRAESELLAFPIAALREAVDQDPRTRWAWIKLLGAQSRQQRLRIERLALKSLRERLQHLIVTEGAASRAYTLPSTRAALAAELGATPEALYRVLAALRAEGTIAIEQSTIRWCE